MVPASARLLLRHIRKLTTAPGDLQSDQALLDDFTAGREVALEALLKRHGAMVMQVCRRVLGDGADADDAFQATVLVLARKAQSIRQRESVGSWLHGVAYRVALKARVSAARRRACESRAAEQAPATTSNNVTWRELRAVLDEELSRLPEQQRVPLVLCYLEDRTQDEAARQLGWSLRTLKRRLQQGRQRLRDRLSRRGLAVGIGLVAAELFRETAAGIPPALGKAAVRMALLPAGQVPAPIAALAEGVGQAVMSKAKMAVVLFFALSATAAAT